MRHFRALVVCGLLVLPLSVPPTASAGPAEDQMIQAINKVRADHGLRRMRLAPSLQSSAGRYANWMMANDWFGHRGAASSRRFRLTGEILEMHRGTRSRTRLAIRLWMNSPGHRAAILRPSFRYIGAGRSRGRFRGRQSVAWVVHFGGRRRK